MKTLSQYIALLVIAFGLLSSVFAEEKNLKIGHHQSDSSENGYVAKFYFDARDIEIVDHVIYLHLGDKLFETNSLRSDPHGLYVLEGDIINHEAINGRDWKCPYCNCWWSFGQKCENKKCPTNRW